jgi:hypothetical protein
LLDVSGFGVTPRADAPLLAAAGVLDLDVGLLPSPNLTNVSTARSKSSFNPLRTISFRRSLVNPISCNAAILDSNEAVVTSATGAPSPVVLLDGNGGGGDQEPPSEVGDVTLGLFPNRRRLDVEDEDRRPNLKNLPDFGGSGGGDPSGELSS